MKPELYQEVVVTHDMPDYGLRAGDVAMSTIGPLRSDQAPAVLSLSQDA